VNTFLTELYAKYVPPWLYNHDEWQPNSGTSCWELTDVFRFYSQTLHHPVEVPTGFRFDKATVPSLPFMYAEFGDRFLRAACGHDYLCRSRMVPRPTADLVFLELMRAEIAEELDAMRRAGADEDSIQDVSKRLEGRALLMYAAVSAYTTSGLWKTDVDKPGYEPVE